MHMKEFEVYPFDELSEDAKNVVRERYRQYAIDYEWWDSVYDIAVEVFRAIGVSVNFRGPGKHKPAIYFSGFASQGDGACFEGDYSYAKGAPEALRTLLGARTPNNLVDVAERLMAIQRKNFFGLSARIKHEGRYYHSGCTRISVEAVGMNGDEREVTQLIESEICECMRDIMHWVYQRLEAEHDWLTSNEQIEESICANEHEYFADGRRA